jgi:8-oxo-dGTP diphosphatase
MSRVSIENATDSGEIPGSVERVGHARGAILEPHQASDIVRAAGGIVVRRSPDGQREIAVVHRPVREDWSFPKGKLEPGEGYEQCALREVREETGLICHLVRFIGHTEYRDRKDRAKVVAYWIMAPEGGSFTRSDEVDEMRWVSFGEAETLLSYDRDRDLLIVVAAADEVSPFG